LSDFTGNTAALLGEIHWKKDVLEAGIVITPLTSHFPRKRSMKHFRGSTGELDELARARHIACLQQRFPRLDWGSYVGKGHSPGGRRVAWALP